MWKTTNKNEKTGGEGNATSVEGRGLFCASQVVLVDRAGRRTLCLVGMAGMCCCAVAMTVGLKLQVCPNVASGSHVLPLETPPVMATYMLLCDYFFRRYVFDVIIGGCMFSLNLLRVTFVVQ